MIIPRKTRNKWKLLQDRGDILRISELNNIDRRKISDALKNGKADVEEFTAISEYFNRKEQLLKTA